MKTVGYRVIDMESYPRKEHFAYFRSLPNPYVGVTVDVDVTELVRFCKEQGISFYLTFMHAVALAADGVPELRQRIHNGGIIEYAHCGTSHTESTGTGLYCYCTLHHEMPFKTYIRYAARTRQACRENASIGEGDDADSLYFITSLPWFKFTSMIQPTAGGDESNPRISWGKYEADYRNRLMMPVALLCHHALADGLHMAAFYDNLPKAMAAITEEGITEEGITE